MWVQVLLALHLANVCHSAVLNDTLVIDQGPLKGSIKTSRNGIDFVFFGGIPYASPPVGNLRFQPPQPAGGWNGTRNATAWPHTCVQFYKRINIDDPVEWTGQEDCLYLNVQTSDTSPEAMKPVMFWIHGGAYNNGDGNMCPMWHMRCEMPGAYLMDEGVVLVSINYRLGPLGFFSLGSPSVSGNQGIRDMILALQWVKNNIIYFGGDPDKVTIFGQSAGGWATFSLMLSPEASGLFRAVISQSSGIIGLKNKFFFSEDEASAIGFLTADLAGCNQGWPEDHYEECMVRKALEDIVAAWTSPEKETSLPRINQDSFSAHGSLFPEDPETLIDFDLHNKVPVLAGFNSAEGATSGKDPNPIWNPDILNNYNEPGAWEKLGPIILMHRTYANGSDWGPCDSFFVNQARNFYFNGTFSAEKLTNWVYMLSDAIFVYPAHATLAKLRSHGAPLYEYMLSFWDETSETGFKRAHDLGLGVPHGDDLPFLFRNDSGSEQWSEANLLTSQRMCAMWANFAKELNPTPNNSSGPLNNFIWEDIDGGNGKILNIGEQLQMEANQTLMDRMNFWKQTEDACTIKI